MEDLNKKISDMQEKDKQEELDKAKITLGESYERLIRILKKYIDLREDYYPLVAIWIIGTYVYEEFYSYPYLFINAMKSSGKSRLLSLIKHTAFNGEHVISIKEAVLFRTAKGKTLCIDEFEGLNKKENAPLRELLNACYKKGLKIQRMKKKKEEFEIEEFEPYTPICLANIYGMEEVLGTRCISLVMDKSFNQAKTSLHEDFGKDIEINRFKSDMNFILVQLCSLLRKNKYIDGWNSYIIDIYTHTTHTTHTTPFYEENSHINNPKSSVVSVYNKIRETDITGRDLELFYPLFLVANLVSEVVFTDLLDIAKQITKGKKEDDVIESMDISVIDFVSKQQEGEFFKIKELTTIFREFLGDTDKDEPWLNARWFGRALKRLNLIKMKRRIYTGIEVVLDVEKAKSKIGEFK